jgi:phosphate starvation-inducible protein PhoH and related proteins
MMKRAKRANRPNPREDRNNVIPFDTDGKGVRQSVRTSTRRRNISEDGLPQRPRTKVTLLPRNLAQEEYVDTLLDQSKHIVFAMGPAGTGKTMMATQYAIKMLMEGRISKIFIARPAVSVEEQHGFVPGDLHQKLAIWNMPILDLFKEHFSALEVAKMFEDEVVELVSLGLLRGRTIKNAILILDEAQNATPSQMKMALTRIGDGSRIIVTGDIKQHDRGYEKNGLADFVERLEGRSSSAIAVCRFANKDIERHPVIDEVLRIYGED